MATKRTNKAPGKAIAGSVVSGQFVAADTAGHHPRSSVNEKSVFASGNHVSQVSARTQFVVSVLGSQAELARMLQISSSQPNRWLSGTESPSPQRERELLDLDHVLARATMIWVPKVAAAWMNGANSFLDGARPIDVLRTRGSGEVVRALDAELAGVFA